MGCLLANSQWPLRLRYRCFMPYFFIIRVAVAKSHKGEVAIMTSPYLQPSLELEVTLSILLRVARYRLMVTSLKTLLRSFFIVLPPSRFNDNLDVMKVGEPILIQTFILKATIERFFMCVFIGFFQVRLEIVHRYVYEPMTAWRAHRVTFLYPYE